MSSLNSKENQPAQLSAGKDRPIIIGCYRLEVFNTARDVTDFINRVHEETGNRPRAWKLTSVDTDKNELVGKYAVEFWISHDGSIGASRKVTKLSAPATATENVISKSQSVSDADENRSRFMVKQGFQGFAVIDTEAARYGFKTDLATTIWYKRRESAQRIADVMNEEWYGFLKNPT